MLFQNKKGDIMIDILMILLLLILFFALNDMITSLVNNVSGVTTDGILIWMLRAFTFFILLGIFRYVLLSGREDI